MRKFIIGHHNHYDFSTSNRIGEFFTEPSSAIPDQTLPIQELVRRYTSGNAVPFIPSQDFSDLPPGVENMSFEDRSVMLYENSLNIQEIRNTLSQASAFQTSDSSEISHTPET